jgi:hypothetical protein
MVFKAVPWLTPVMPARVALLSPVVLKLSCHASQASTRRDVHIQSTAYTLAHLGVTDKQFGNRVKITTNFIY